MKKLSLILTVLALFIAFKGFCQETPIQNLTARFLKVIESKSEPEATKFIEANYSDFFLRNVPMSIHMRVMKDLQADYYKNIIVSETLSATKVVLVIKSLVNSKTKKITIETDPHNTQKIFIIDVKDVIAG